jgi:2-oxoglutarate ferredoxin oxidoreductase subunit gamma
VEIRLAGSGGQGIILAGLVLAEAAGIYEGREAAMVQSYGPEARGGASKAEIIISDRHIDYPLCTRVDALLAMTQEAADAYSWDLKPGARVFVDRDLVRHPPTSRAIALPFTATARGRLKAAMVANVVALGAIIEVTGLISRRSLDRALQARFTADTRTLNKRAVSLGIKLARECLRKQMAEQTLEPKAEDM